MDEKKIGSKDVLIIRQSSLKIAQEALCCKMNGNYSLNELIKTTDILVDYCLYGYDEVKERVNKFDKYVVKKNDGK